MEMYIFLLVSTAMFKYSSTSCDIINRLMVFKGHFYSEEVATFQCTNSSLQEIFITNSENSTKHYFYVSESSLISLIPDARTWSGLLQLTLENTNVSKIVPGFFNGFTELNLLSIPHNNITVLNNNVFGSLKNLNHLNLSYNSIYNIESLAFTGLSELTVLDLHNNKIKSLPSKLFFALSNLTICNLSHNGITFVGTHFISDWVSMLDLSFNSVYNISSNAFDKGTHLTHLYLNNNNLKELSIGTFKGQENLEYLDLSNNKIFYFESGLFNNLGSLKYLNISCNEGILDFQALFRLRQLETLDFEKNQPESFDKFFLETHGNLREIRMGYNTLNCGDLAKIIHLIEKRGITLLKGNNVNSTHIHGIECKSNSQYISKNEGKENVSHNQSLDLFDKNVDNTGTNNVQTNNELYFINLNLYFNNVFLVLIFCSFLALIWYLKKRNIVQSKDQVELLDVNRGDYIVN